MSTKGDAVLQQLQAIRDALQEDNAKLRQRLCELERGRPWPQRIYHGFIRRRAADLVNRAVYELHALRRRLPF
jgi:hypothetical protein